MIKKIILILIISLMLFFVGYFLKNILENYNISEVDDTKINILILFVYIISFVYGAILAPFSMREKNKYFKKSLLKGLKQSIKIFKSGKNRI